MRERMSAGCLIALLCLCTWGVGCVRAFDPPIGGYGEAIPVGDGSVDDGDGGARDAQADGAAGDGEVASDPTSITYNRSWRVYLRLHTSPAIVPVFRGGAPSSYSVAPALPAGLSLDPETGKISGAPTGVVDSSSHVITGANSKGSAKTTLVIEVGDGFLVDTATHTADVSPGDGACADAAGSCSLRAAVEESNARAGAQVVFVPAGTHRISSTLSVTDDLMIVGAGSSSTLVDGGNAVRILGLSQLKVFRLSDITLDRGKGPAGASLFSNGITPDLALHLSNCVIQNGDATGDTGGLWNSRDGITTVEHSLFRGCTSGAHGGALALGFSTRGEIRRCEFESNTADGDGGAVYLNFDTVVEDNTFSNNTAAGAASRGGGLFIHGKTQVLRNNTFSDNTATRGGALFVDGGTSELLNNTIVHNEGTSEAGGIGGTGGVELHNTLVLNNTGGDCGAPVAADTASFEGGASCGLSGAGSRQNVDAAQVKLSALQDNGGPVPTMAPALESVAVDAGDNAHCSPLDARGDRRPIDRGDGAGGGPDGVATCDVGAVEVQ